MKRTMFLFSFFFSAALLFGCKGSLLPKSGEFTLRGAQFMDAVEVDGKWQLTLNKVIPLEGAKLTLTFNKDEFSIANESETFTYTLETPSKELKANIDFFKTGIDGKVSLINEEGNPQSTDYGIVAPTKYMVDGKLQDAYQIATHSSDIETGGTTYHIYYFA